MLRGNGISSRTQRIAYALKAMETIRYDRRDRETNLQHARCVVPRLSLLVHLGNQRVPLRMLDAINVKVYVQVGPVEVPIPLFDDNPR